MNYRKHKRNCTFLVLLLTGSLIFSMHLHMKAALEQEAILASLQHNRLPEDEIEQIIDDCLSDKFPTKSFYAFILEVIDVINMHKTYFIQKYSPNLDIEQLLRDLRSLEYARTARDVQKVFDKYKHHSWMFGKRKRNPTQVVLALARRLKIRKS